jgi:hypothetical protein
MPPPKGSKSNNPNGRPKGKGNRITEELKERIKSFLDANFESVTDSFKELEPEKKVLLYEKFLGYCVPRQKEDNVNISISKLSDSEIDQLLTRLIQK